MRNYEDKYYCLWKLQEGRCAISGKAIPFHPCALENSSGNKIDMHHLLHKTKWRIKKYPHFIDSILNLRLCWHTAHMSNHTAMELTDHQAEAIENELNRNKKFSELVNNPSEESHAEIRSCISGKGDLDISNPGIFNSIWNGFKLGGIGIDADFDNTYCN